MRRALAEACDRKVALFIFYQLFYSPGDWNTPLQHPDSQKNQTDAYDVSVDFINNHPDCII
jgi:hypothetical protein